MFWLREHERGVEMDNSSLLNQVSQPRRVGTKGSLSTRLGCSLLLRGYRPTPRDTMARKRNLRTAGRFSAIVSQISCNMTRRCLNCPRKRCYRLLSGTFDLTPPEMTPYALLPNEQKFDHCVGLIQFAISGFSGCGNSAENADYEKSTDGPRKKIS